MDVLTVTKENALKAHGNASSNGKKMLENLFGKKTFQRSILERVCSFEDACEELGKDPEQVLAAAADDYERSERRIKTVAEALREGKPAEECSYYPYFRSSGGGFSYHDYRGADDCSDVGARLRVDSYEKAIHLGRCMLDDYKFYLGRTK